MIFNSDPIQHSINNLVEYTTVNMDSKNNHHVRTKKLIQRNFSFYIFPQKNKFRIFLKKVVEHKIFFNLNILIILGACIVLIIDDPFQAPNSKYNFNLFAIDIAFFGFFFCEIFAKCIVYGVFLNGPDSYLKNDLNFLDFCLTLVNFIGTLEEQINFSPINLKFLRACRFIKICYFSQGIKTYAHILIMSIPEILRVLFFYFTNLLFFGAIAVRLFKGGFYYCSKVDNYLSLIKRKSECFDFGGDWLNKDVNYDNIFVSISSLFQFCTTEGWMWLM
jgi:hypothetical protein